MKIIIRLLIVISCTWVHSQKTGKNTAGGEFKYKTQHNACLTPSERRHIIKNLKSSLASLKTQKRESISKTSIPSTKFIWPVKQLETILYNEIWVITNYVDHNAQFPNQITDYNGGNRSYDTNNGYNHQGTDIFIWPYSWKTMDEDGLQVIAAASGEIIYKNDGEYDRICALNNSNNWNAIYIKHDDGSVAWYGHLKEFSITNKAVGDVVAQGEYLGVVGSSGNSTGPHLHFEVYEDDTFNINKLIDPYQGPNNNLNSTSWWASQKPYRNPAINALTTNTSDPDFGTCPEAETTNESNQFSINDTVFFIAFLKDQYPGSELNIKVFDPMDNEVYNFDRTMLNDFNISWWRYSGTVNQNGVWRVQATFDGQVLNHEFNVGTLNTKDFNLDKISVYPNPVKDVLQISSKVKISSAILKDVLGKKVLSVINSGAGVNKLDTQFLTEGLYFLSLSNDDGFIKTIKIIKK